MWRIEVPSVCVVANMSMDDRLKSTPDVRWRNAGTGHASGWQCAACARKLYTMQGRKLRRVNGLRSYVCAGCAK